MHIQVLVATMNQHDDSIVNKMNICCDSIVANQTDREEIKDITINGFKHKIISTRTRGVGLNRNIALLASDSDIVVFADDDVVYNDDMATRVKSAFDEVPQADIIVFGLDMVKNGEVFERRRCKKQKLHIWNSMKYGTCRIAARRKALIDKNITFHQCFGGGCVFSMGEDSLFLKKCFDSGLKVYSYDYVLGTCSKDQSSWFTEYNEKYFFDKGVLIRNLFPYTAYLMIFYFGLFFKRNTSINVPKRLSLMFSGVRAGKRMIPYRE